MHHGLPLTHNATVTGGLRVWNIVQHDQLDTGKLRWNTGSSGSLVFGLVSQSGAEHAVHFVSEVGDVAQSTPRLREPGRQRVLADDQDAADHQETGADERHGDQDAVADRRSSEKVGADHLRLAGGDGHRARAGHVDEGRPRLRPISVPPGEVRRRYDVDVIISGDQFKRWRSRNGCQTGLADLPMTSSEANAASVLA